MVRFDFFFMLLLSPLSSWFQGLVSISGFKLKILWGRHVRVLPGLGSNSCVPYGPISHYLFSSSYLLDLHFFRSNYKICMKQISPHLPPFLFQWRSIQTQPHASCWSESCYSASLPVNGDLYVFYCTYNDRKHQLNHWQLYKKRSFNSRF